jgi:membrane associated rhomboid family serine protease
LEPTNQRMFNVPTVVVGLLALLAFIQIVVDWFLTQEDKVWLLLNFAFIPARYESSVLPGGLLPGGLGADLWTFVTYALIHGDFNHLFFNAIWLLAFGTPLARRFGTGRFLVFMAVTAAAGAVAHLISHRAEFLPMVGASAAISGAMGAAARFVFQRGGPLGILGASPESAERIPRASLTATLRDPRVLVFLAVWLGINLLFGLGTLALPGTADAAVAWEAHIGGFLVGLLAFGLFDPVPPAGNPGQYRAQGRW